MANFTRFATFPIFSHQSGSEWQILPNLQLFQSFPIEVTQNDLERPILPDSQLFQSFPTKVAQNDSGQQILHQKKSTIIQPIQQRKKKHYDTREFL